MVFNLVEQDPRLNICSQASYFLEKQVVNVIKAGVLVSPTITGLRVLKPKGKK